MNHTMFDAKGDLTETVYAQDHAEIATHLASSMKLAAGQD